MLKRLIVFFSIIFVSVNLFAQDPVVKTGIDVLIEQDFALLNGKRIGLITNQTGVSKDLISTIDIFHDSYKVDLVALFAPEHGIRGELTAGEKVESYFDTLTNVKVHSLYGKNKKPSNEILKNIDALVYDIQDIGSRSYTYINTMGLAMEAAARNNIEFIVLDRPNPLGGNKIEGNLIEKGFFSFIGKYKIPYIYGMTCGELASFINGERQLQDSLICDLKVVEMEGWKRDMHFSDTGLKWVPTSPHIPNYNSPVFYAATGILGELGVINNGVGYTKPFELIGAEWINGNLLAKKLNELKLKNVYFRPATYKPYYTKFKNRTLNGVQIYIENIDSTDIIEIQFRILKTLRELYPKKNIFDAADKNSIDMFDKAIGTNKIRIILDNNFPFRDIKRILNNDTEKFKDISKKYYLYD